MSLHLPNPRTFSAEVQRFLQVVVLTLTVIGSVTAGARWVMSSIYDVAAAQTVANDEFRQVSGQLQTLDKRTVALENAVSEAHVAAAAAAQAAMDMKEDLRDLKSIAEDNLRISNSHTAVLNDTRKAVTGK